MSKQAEYPSLSATSLAASSSTVVPLSVAKGSKAPASGLSLVRPCYYLERPDGTLTALVEVDQLPENVRIRGLPHKLSTAETTGMTSVGIREGGQRKYNVEIAESSAYSHHVRPSKLPANKISGPENVSVTIASAPSSKTPSSPMIVVNKNASNFIPTCTEQETVIFRPIVRKGQKIYCTYWIARGECHFAQQGCKFKHEMPNLETLENIMGRRSFPKWWLESIGLISAPPPHLRHTATNDRQQGKRRVNIAKPFALPAPTNTYANSTSAPPPASIVVPAPPEGNVVNLLPNSPGNKFATRRVGGVDIRSHVSVASGSIMVSPAASPSGSNIRIPSSHLSVSNIRSSISSLSAGNTRSSISDPSGGNIRAAISDPSSSHVRASISSPTSSNIISQSKHPVHEFRSTDLESNSNIRPLIPGLSGNMVINGKQSVSNIRSPHDSSPSCSNKIQTKQAVSNERSSVSGTMSNTSNQITNQPNKSLTASASSVHQATAPHPLRIKIPGKYTPPFHVTVLPTLSSFPTSSSAISVIRPRVNLPPSRRQDIGNSDDGEDTFSSTLGCNANANGGKNENRGAEIVEGRPNEGGIAYFTTTTATGVGGSRSNRGYQTTRPYDEVFDLLGPF